MRSATAPAPMPPIAFLGPPHAGEDKISRHLGDQGVSVLKGLKGRFLLPHRLPKLPAARAHVCLFSGANSPSAQIFAPNLVHYLQKHHPGTRLVLNLPEQEEWMRAARNDADWTTALRIAWGLGHQELPNALIRIYRAHADLESAGIPRLRMNKDWPERLDMVLQTRPRSVNRPTFPAPVLGATRLPASDQQLVDALVRHSIGQRSKTTAPARALRASQLWCTWHSDGTITDFNGAPVNLRTLASQPTPLILKTGQPNKLHRTQAFLNEYAQHSGSPSVTNDFQDARFFGCTEADTPRRQVFTYNRRAGAKNVVLWPLALYHQPFTPTFVSQQPIDVTAFDDKRDLCVWRGALAGRTKRALLPSLTSTTGTGKLLQSLKRSAAEQSDAITLLRATTRFNLTERLQNNADFDFAFAQSETEPLTVLSHLFAPRVAPSWFYQFKYAASLSGHDTGSNFLTIVNSNSLAFKEEDGWELFYTSVFKPWEHYVPLQDGAQDIEEKLDWARGNPKACNDMTKSARILSAQLANLSVRRAMLFGIVEETAV